MDYLDSLQEMFLHHQLIEKPFSLERGCILFVINSKNSAFDSTLYKNSIGVNIKT